jgi:hypothetical protein
MRKLRIFHDHYSPTLHFIVIFFFILPPSNFCRDGNLLASGGLDCALKLWDYARLAKEFAAESSGPGAATPDATPHNPDVRVGEEESLLLGCYPTKKTPIFELHFTRRNLLVGAGAFDGGAHSQAPGDVVKK